MKFTYDHRYNIAYIRFREKHDEIDSVRISDELVVDMAPDGTLYGIELLNPNEQLRRDETEKLLIINEPTGEHVEFPTGDRLSVVAAHSGEKAAMILRTTGSSPAKGSPLNWLFARSNTRERRV